MEFRYLEEPYNNSVRFGGCSFRNSSLALVMTPPGLQMGIKYGVLRACEDLNHFQKLHKSKIDLHNTLERNYLNFYIIKFKSFLTYGLYNVW